MARYDKYEGKAGGFRAPLAAAWASSEVGKPYAVGLNTSGQVVKGAGNSGVVGVLIITKAKAAGDIVDVMTNGEIVEAPLKTKNAYAAVLAQAQQRRDEQARQDSRKEASKAIFDADTLTTELAELLIDRVLVYPDKRIEIAYKIQDIFA